MTPVPESVPSYLAAAGVDGAPLPTIRPRRLRSTPAMRALVRETHVDPAKLSWESACFARRRSAVRSR